MSLVVVTPTQIACDHCVVIQTRPKKTIIDKSHMKFFVHPDNTFVYALCGEFDTATVQIPYFSDMMKSLFLATIKAYEESTLEFEGVLLEEHFSDYLGFLKFLIKYTLSSSYLVMLVSKKYRFIFQIIPQDDEKNPYKFQTKIMDDNCAIGYCQGYAMGLLEGGMDMKTVFEKCFQMSPAVSLEYSVFDLDNLVDLEKGE